MQLIAVGALMLAFTFPQAPLEPGPGACGTLYQCDANSDSAGGAVDMEVWTTEDPGYDDGAASNGSRPGAAGGTTSLPTYTPPDMTNLCGTDNLSPLACGTGAPVDPTAPAPAAPVYPTVITAYDLASFTPQRPTITGEPEHAGLIGQPTNIVGATNAHTQQGTLFGFPVLAHFTPSSYTFNYGDGTSFTSTTGGTTWASRGLPQFADAPTAHAYAQRGTYTASITVNYAAYVAFPDGIWRPVNGTVGSSSSYDLQIYKAQSALVNYTCIEKPDGIGC